MNEPWALGSFEKFQKQFQRGNHPSSYSQSLLALGLSSCSQSHLCCYCCHYTIFPCTHEFLTVRLLSFMAGECRIQMSFFLLIFIHLKNFISFLASRSQSIHSLRMLLSTHYTKTLHPISLIIIQQHSFPPPLITLLHFNTTLHQSH